jgi:Flp pilus assembly protein TadG
MRRRIEIRDERGQSMVELALILPVLLLILFGIVQFGTAFNNYVALTDAVRAGARTAAVSGGSTDPVGAAVARVDSSAADLSTSKLNVVVNSDWVPGDDVTVKATYPYAISLFGVVVASGQLTSTTTERVE